MLSWLKTHVVATAVLVSFNGIALADDSSSLLNATASVGESAHNLRLEAGQTIAVSVRVNRPSSLPENTRLHASWSLLKADNPSDVPRMDDAAEGPSRKVNEFGIYTAPTPNWSKLLHALDSDVSLVYTAPISGSYELRVAPATDATDLFSGQPNKRWREGGQAAEFTPLPESVAWPEGATFDVDISVELIDVSGQAAAGFYIEAEPNDTPEQAQSLIGIDATDNRVIHILGSNDDIEYFDNGHVGRSGDDWFRIDYSGDESRLLTACLSTPDQQVVARIRAYRVPLEHVTAGLAAVTPGKLLPLAEYDTGKNPNERAHQQSEQHRTAINRTLEPGGVYFLRVEANAPGYDLELRIVKPAPYDDPKRAINHGLYDHLGQVDAWITNRPRGASVERRIRDSGNLLGTNCMSCHTQSGVWGPAVPLAQGYRPQNIQAWRHLVNTCYQSMRPTNELVDAANNTSLAPYDLGDGPAGTRVAGHAVVALERFSEPRKLQSKQAIRAANFVLQSSDPGGINAAGPGANVGQGVVFNYAGEVVASAWQKTGEARYFHAMEDKGRRMLDISVKFTDDLGHRVEFLNRFWPKDYVDTAARVAEQEGLDAAKTNEALTKAHELQARIDQTVSADLARLRSIQMEDGSWGFNPGTPDGDCWKNDDTKPDPSPTALALLAFEAAGVGKDDPTVAKGIQALLKQQHPTGYWNGQSQTGFVSTSYALHALSRYFPTEPEIPADNAFDGSKSELLVDTTARVRRMSLTEDERFLSQMETAAKHESPLVRYWGMIGLGGLHSPKAALTLAGGLGDRWKMVREAAHWGLRQTLINDAGWNAVLKSVESPDDYTRESAMRALIMKVDGVMPGLSVDWNRVTRAFDFGLNHDPHPGVRAWTTRAAWQWWVWNPPVRDQINHAWQDLLVRPEPNLIVENAIRYQTHALFIANGHIANQTRQHQYTQLKDLFEGLRETLRKSAGFDEQLHRHLSGRLTAVAATFYKTRGGDGGPGQMGYATEGAPELFADAVLSQLAYVEQLPEDDHRTRLTRISLEGAANIPHEQLLERLVDYSLNGPEELRGLAAASISDPRLVSFVAVPEQLEPMFRQLVRGANDPQRRADLADPILKMYGGVHWILPDGDEQREEILQYIIPDLTPWKRCEQLDAITDAAEKQAVERATDATWYLADGLGEAVAKNPDLHFAQMVDVLPLSFTNDAEARFWLRSVEWILNFQQQLPEVKVDLKQLPPIDPYEEIRTRAVQLFLTQLTEGAQAENRKLAVDLANRTALKKNPEILTALAAIESFEQDKGIVDGVKKILSQQLGQFKPQLTDAVAKETNHGFETDDDGKPVVPDDFLEDITFFRDYVVPEMTKVLRGDERSCMICHGEPGRVPSMELHAPDQVGFLDIDKLLANYRILQKRVNVADVESSKLLRKPLNVQSGKEDGHQGGRRYQPMDPGYLILKRWVNNQLELQKKYQLVIASDAAAAEE
jgi:hypothetical protein